MNPRDTGQRRRHELECYALDPHRQLLIANTNNIPFEVRLSPRAGAKSPTLPSGEPASGHATPMTYQYRGKQYVVIAAGGHAKLEEEPLSDALVAFALP